MEKPEENTVIDLQEPVSLSFALRYLNSFAKASPLSHQVQTLHKLCSCSPHDACTVSHTIRSAVHVSADDTFLFIFIPFFSTQLRAAYIFIQDQQCACRWY